MSVAAHITIEGHVSRGFESVRDVFRENFADRNELGAAFCMYCHGEKVVDIWGGVRNAATGERWEKDTMVLVYSATKGLTAMAMAVAHSRGWLDYEERVCKYWPQFARNGKDEITVRQLLAHQAGLFAFDEPVTRDMVKNPDQLAEMLARQKPAWPPGARQAYHAISLGFFQGEILRRIDPHHRTLGSFFQDKIASPLGLDVYIRLPQNIPNSRLALLESPTMWKMLTGMPFPLVLAAMNPRSILRRALQGSDFAHDGTHIYARNLEIPSGGGVGTARALAHAYGIFATGGRQLRLREETLAALAAPAIPSEHGFYDECMKGEVQFSLGFMKPNATWPFGSLSAFGAPGAGGALGFADPKSGVGYAYVTNRMGAKVTGDPREVALRKSAFSALSR